MSASALNPDVSAAFEAIAAKAARLSPESLPQITELPPEPYRVLTVSGTVDRETFDAHAWPMLVSNAVNDPTITGEPIGFMYTVGGGTRALQVFWTEDGRAN